MPLRLVISIKSHVLLISLAILLLMTPLLAELHAKGLSSNIIWSLVIIASIVHASENKFVRFIVFVLAGFWMTMTYAPFEVPQSFRSLVVIILFVLSVVILLLNIFKGQEVTSEILCDALSVYLLFGIIWSFLYYILFQINPGAFVIPRDYDDYEIVLFIYYSFVTLTTLGYGDILPVSPTARILSVAEAVTGVLYIAVLVAKLVSLYRSGKE